MKDRIIGLLGGRRRRTLIGATAATAVAGVLAISAIAGHDETFQLDGDVLSATTTNVGGQTQMVDWDALFDASGGEKALPAGFNASVFDRDFETNTNGTFNTTDTSTYATGSKDTLPISGWQCNKDNNVSSKTDIVNSYAASYSSGGSRFIYFAQERNTNTGDANVGFWFLQDGVSCTSNGGATTFTGAHKDGDLFIVSAFSNGGTVSTIDVYRWVGGANGALDPTPVAHGADCEGPALGDDKACATSNKVSDGTNGTITTPWLTANKIDGVGHSLRTSMFFEGTVNLTLSNLDDKCFNSFLGNTRSSTSLTATIFDFSGGTIGECMPTLVTTPKSGADGTGSFPAGGTTIPADGTLIVRDSAVLAVEGLSAWDSSIAFFLCGPSDLGSSGTCTSGGVSVGSVDADAAGTYLSPAATVTSVGRYCWRAEFAGDASVGLTGKTDSAITECFKVLPRTPTLSTNAGPDVAFGQPITDTATLGNTANRPGSGGPTGSNGTINPTVAGAAAGGQITFRLYKGDVCSEANQVYSTTVNVSGNGVYGPVSFTPTSPGTYRWVASYPGDAPNTSAAAAQACLDANEDVVVSQIPTTLKTRQSWIPNDTATVGAAAGNLGAGGTVEFKLYDSADCSGTAIYSENRPITGGSPTETVSTTNTTFAITTGFADAANSVKQPYSWRVTYTPAAADTAHTGRRSTCAAEKFSITYSNDNGPGTVFP